MHCSHFGPWTTSVLLFFNVASTIYFANLSLDFVDQRWQWIRQWQRDSSHEFWCLGLDSRFSENDSTRVTINDSRLKSESFLKNLWPYDGQTHFVCTQRTEHILFQLWSRLAQIFCFDCLVVLCYISRIKSPQLVLRKTQPLL